MAQLASLHAGSACHPSCVASLLSTLPIKPVSVMCVLKNWSAPSYDPDAHESARSLIFEEGQGTCSEAEVTGRRCRQMLNRI
jgi:hypothetical protein